MLGIFRNNEVIRLPQNLKLFLFQNKVNQTHPYGVLSAGFFTVSPLSNSFLPDDTEVCLISKKESKLVKELLKSAGLTSVKKVISLTKLRKNYKSYEAKRQLATLYDVFVCEDAIYHLLPKFLGKAFFARKNAIRIGHTGQTADEVVSNIIEAAQGIAKIVPRGWNNIKSLDIKTSDSISLPIHNSLPERPVALESETPPEEVIQKKGKKNKTQEMESGNRDLMNMLLHGGSTENGSQQSLESFGQQYTSPVSMSGHTTSMQPPLTSPMGQQQGSPFHGQMISQNPMMQQGDMMSTPYSQSPTSYSDSTYQGYPGYNQQRMSHPQVSSTMYQNYGQNGSFLSSLGNQGVGQYSAQSRAMSQYPASTSSVGFGPPSYYSDVYPPVPPKSPAAHQQLQGSGYPSSIQGTMSVGGNGSSYPSTGYAGQSSMSPLQKPMGQSFFPPRSPASQQINSPPNMTGNYPGQPPTSPMAQPMVGHPRRSSTSPVSSMVPQGVPVYSVPQRQQYPTTTSSMSQSQLQSSCMFAQRLEKMSAQHQYQAQMSSSNLPGPTGSGLSPSRRATFPAQQSHLPGMHTMKTATGPVSPVQRSPPQIGKSSPPFKPLRSPPPYQAHKSPPSFPKTLVPIPYPPQGGNDTRKQEKGATVSGSVPEGGQPPAKKARKSKSAEKSIFQKLEEVAENVTPYLAEGLSHAVGDTVEQKQSQTKTKASTTEDDNEVNPKTTTEAEVSKADKLSSEGNVEEKDSLKDSQAKDSVPETGDKEEDGANETVSGKDTKVDEDKGQDKVVKHNEDVIIKEESTPKAQCEKEKSKETDKKEDSTNDDTKQHSAKSKDKVVSPINKEAQVCASSDTCKLPTTEKESPDTHSKVPNQAGPNESTTEKETSDKSKAIKETSRINFASVAVNKPTTKHDAHQKVVLLWKKILQYFVQCIRFSYG
ncbi:hypothetical protein QZH41_000782 [Actinostola sp. cb2023]|nr:hypothetical protein QZH41_000782 [Actinostola sp. cb2023]